MVSIKELNTQNLGISWIPFTFPTVKFWERYQELYEGRKMKTEIIDKLYDVYKDVAGELGVYPGMPKGEPATPEQKETLIKFWDMMTEQSGYTKFEVISWLETLNDLSKSGEIDMKYIKQSVPESSIESKVEKTLNNFASATKDLPGKILTNIYLPALVVAGLVGYMYLKKN